MQIQQLNAEDIKPYNKNPRKNDDAVNVVAKSLEEFGFQQPLVLDENNVIVVGHTRFRAAKKIGLATVPCVIAKGLTSEQINAYRIMDNKSAEYASWHDGLLVQEMTSLLEADYDLDLTGFSSLELKDLGFDLDLGFVEEGLTDEDDVPDLPDEPVTKLGDVWQLGSHRLMCGDSTNMEAVGMLMGGQKADMVFTDPPYGMAYGGGRAAGSTLKGAKVKAHGMIIGDDFKGNDLIEMIRDAVGSAVSFCKSGASKYICFPWRTYSEFEKALSQISLLPV